MCRFARRPQVFRLALFLACTLAFAGPVCALPAAHEAAAGSGRAHEDGLAAARCEPVAAQPGQTPGLVGASEPVVTASAPAAHAIPPGRQAPVIERPPRFLLHASLLI